jgi:putative adenylate-forming enzyme
MSDRLLILWHFIRTRWLLRFRSREQLLSWQKRRLDQFLKSLVRNASFYRDLSPCLDCLPVLEKTSYRSNFDGLNSSGILLVEAEAVALKAESQRDFTPALPGGVTVGLSSGTSGSRGVFLVDRNDRCRWAGIILARVLSKESLAQLLVLWRPALRVAFFLRADSRLYRTVGGRRLDFRYFDLTSSWTDLLAELEEFKPDVLIAPATVLAELARARMSVRPRQIVSVAEVLDDRDSDLIRESLGVEPSQIYQATEGFLGWTCESNRIHVNEEFVHMEPQWLDESRTRFHPVITDFSRSSQYFVRYRLDDILVAGGDCECGRPTRVIARIEGRADEVLWLPKPVFPDAIRQALYSVQAPLDLYRLEQRGRQINIMLRTSSPSLETEVRNALLKLFQQLGVPPPLLQFQPWVDQPRTEKKRRIHCLVPMHI